MDFTLDTAEKCFDTAAPFQRSAVGYGQQYQVDGPHLVIHAAAAQQIVSQFIAAFKCGSVMENVKNITDISDSLENSPKEDTAAHGNGEAWQGRQL